MFGYRRDSSLTEKRKKLPWPKDKIFKILSLDGGGIRGIYGSAILASIEKEITNNEPLAKYFDLIAGTSTGGIMALALGLEISAEKINNLYQVDGEKIFPRLSNLKKNMIVQGINNEPLYDYAVLESLIKEQFGEKIFGDAVTRLVIAGFKIPELQVAVFKTDHHEDYKNDYHSKAWQIARATSAAPTFFKGLVSDDNVFLDGGFWANNPVMLAVVEALSAYEITTSQIRILSIGTGNFSPDISAEDAQKGLRSWMAAIHLSMFLTTDNALSQAQLLVGHDLILRLAPKDIKANISLDDWRGATEVLPPLAVKDFNVNKELVAEFFKDKVTEREKFYSGA